jgi:serine/threonine protein kinase
MIAGKYKIIEKIGEGGMGIVYKAEDTKLKRNVALKFLPSELTRDNKAKARFMQEAQAAAALNHPHICTVYEVDESDDQTFIAMEFIEGKTLKDRIEAGPLAVDLAADIASQVAEGLGEAHKKGVFHRDIKPGNIMLTEKGQAKIMDFGLAKLSWGADLTKPSMIMGTVAYMSPEQARGEPVDHRTDIWSLGAMLFEMLAGEKPFQKSQEHALIHAILNEKPKPLITTRPDIPRAIERAVLRALEKDPARRHHNIAELLKDLKSTAVAGVGMAKEDNSIIVLPFEDMSPGKDNEYFSDGLTEEIIADLCHIHDLLVISRSSAMTFKGTKKTIPEIAQAVNVRYVLEGSVRKAGNGLRITAQLIDSTNDTHLWAEKYSGTLDDVFDIQEKVSRSIVGALEVKLSPNENDKLAKRPIDNVQAYEYYLKASEDITKFSEDSIHRALRYLENAVDITGDNALLYSGLAFAYWNLVNIGVEHEEYLDRAEEFTKKALEVNPESSLAYVILGYVDFFHERTLESLPRFKKALGINRDEIFALVGIVCVYLFVGKITEAMPYAERLMRLDPLSYPANWCNGASYYYDGKFDRALEAWQRLYELHPDNPYGQFQFSTILAYNRETDRALSIIDQCVKSYPKTVFAKLSLILKYALQGEKKKVVEVIDSNFEKTVRRDCGFAGHLSGLLALMGLKKEALDWLEKAIKNGLINYPFLAEKDIFLENIRGEPRFKKLMERVKHEWENFEV